MIIRSSHYLTYVSTTPQHNAQCLILSTIIDNNARCVVLFIYDSQNSQHSGFANARLPSSDSICFCRLRVVTSYTRRSDQRYEVGHPSTFEQHSAFLPAFVLRQKKGFDARQSRVTNCDTGIAQQNRVLRYVVLLENQSNRRVHCIKVSCIAWSRSRDVTISFQVFRRGTRTPPCLWPNQNANGPSDLPGF